MTNFTTLVKRGKQKYVSKYLKKREFGKCEGCKVPCLLIEYVDDEAPNPVYWKVCDFCYNKLMAADK